MQVLHDAFFATLGSGAEAVDLFLEMADLLPTAELRFELLGVLHAPEEGGGDAPGVSAARDPGSLQQQHQQQEGEEDGAAPAVSQLPATSTSAPQRQRQQRTLAQVWDITPPNSEGAYPAKRAAASGARGARKRDRQQAAAVAAAAAQAAGKGGEPPPHTSGVLVWLRQDLRLHDHPALVAAAADARAAGGHVTLVYVHSPAEEGGPCSDPTASSWRPTGAALLWLHHALAALDADARERYGPGAGLLYLAGPAAPALRAAAAALGAGAVYWSRRYDPAGVAADAEVERELGGAGMRVRSFGALLLR